MSGSALTYIGSLTALVWGVAHLIPTRNVVAGFGEISKDNQRILAMEWVTEGVALIFVGVLVAVVTWIDPGSAASTAVYWVSAGFLLALAVVSLFTGFRVSFLPFKLCPFIFTGSAVLVLVGAYMR
jgi:hypothetical protein